MNKIEEQYVKAKAVVEKWNNKTGHDCCWYYPELFKELAEIFGIPPQNQSLPSREEFENGCKRYQDEIYANQLKAAWIKSRNEVLAEEIKEVKQYEDTKFQCHFTDSQEKCSNTKFCLMMSAWFLVASGFIALLNLEYWAALSAFGIAAIVFFATLLRK
jgi:hypothetical protein